MGDGFFDGQDRDRSSRRDNNRLSDERLAEILAQAQRARATTATPGTRPATRPAQENASITHPPVAPHDFWDMSDPSKDPASVTKEGAVRIITGNRIQPSQGRYDREGNFHPPAKPIPVQPKLEPKSNNFLISKNLSAATPRPQPKTSIPAIRSLDGDFLRNLSNLPEAQRAIPPKPDVKSWDSADFDHDARNQFRSSIAVATYGTNFWQGFNTINNHKDANTFHPESYYTWRPGETWLEDDCYNDLYRGSEGQTNTDSEFFKPKAPMFDLAGPLHPFPLFKCTSCATMFRTLPSADHKEWIDLCRECKFRKDPKTLPEPTKLYDIQSDKRPQMLEARKNLFETIGTMASLALTSTSTANVALKKELQDKEDQIVAHEVQLANVQEKVIYLNHKLGHARRLANLTKFSI